MGQFTTEQLQNALVVLYHRTDAEAQDAYRMTFEEVHARMGDEAFDTWCGAQGF